MTKKQGTFGIYFISKCSLLFSFSLLPFEVLWDNKWRDSNATIFLLLPHKSCGNKRQNAANFFKDRHWLTREFPQLANTGLLPSSLSLNMNDAFRCSFFFVCLVTCYADCCVQEKESPRKLLLSWVVELETRYFLSYGRIPSSSFMLLILPPVP